MDGESREREWMGEVGLEESLTEKQEFGKERERDVCVMSVCVCDESAVV